jgi:cytochrome c553
MLIHLNPPRRAGFAAAYKAIAWADIPSLLVGLLALCGAIVIAPAADADNGPPASSVVSSADTDAAAQIAGQVCSNCHGPGGHSQSPLFPQLAGQQELYLAAQIRAFQNKTRGDPEAHNYMWGMATLISEPMVDALAEFYSRQPPPPGKTGNPGLVEKGKVLFEQGVPERGIAACASCHGSDAGGRSIFPRLAGQHAPYLVRQLEVIQAQLRKSPIMHGIIRDLKPDEIKAVAEYLQSK